MAGCPQYVGEARPPMLDHRCSFPLSRRRKPPPLSPRPAVALVSVVPLPYSPLLLGEAGAVRGCARERFGSVEIASCITRTVPTRMSHIQPSLHPFGRPPSPRTHTTPSLRHPTLTLSLPSFAANRRHPPPHLPPRYIFSGGLFQRDFSFVRNRTGLLQS